MVILFFIKYLNLILVVSIYIEACDKEEKDENTRIIKIKKVFIKEEYWEFNISRVGILNSNRPLINGNGIIIVIRE